MQDYLTAERTLPADGTRGTLVGRVQLPGRVPGPAVVAVREAGVFDLTARTPTLSLLMNAPDPLAIARDPAAPRIGDLAPMIKNSAWDRRDPALPWLLAPADLQALKAAGVTFVKSMLERVIEEQARGDHAKAEGVRKRIEGAIGGSLRSIRPGSEAAMKVKEHLVAEGLWSQYLEVGIGPDAEIFTKAQPMSAVGHGALAGIHPKSSWNNPEPEVVLVVSGAGRIVGATLGNDVNLRDFEGRSALLLSKAKDNNASCAIGPLVRLFDESFGLDDVREAEVELLVQGEDGFRLEGKSSMAEISRDPEELVAHTIGRTHQYPDGFLLFCGTMFAPTQDRLGPGQGFTHKPGDLVVVASERLGALANRIETADRIAPWDFGLADLMRNLSARGLLGSGGRLTGAANEKGPIQSAPSR